MTKLKQSPSPYKWTNPSPYRLGGRGAKNLTAVFTQSEQQSVQQYLFTPEPVDKSHKKYYLYKGSNPCIVQAVSEMSDTFVQTLKPNPINLDLLIPCDGHVWSAKRELLYPIKVCIAAQIV